MPDDLEERLGLQWDSLPAQTGFGGKLYEGLVSSSFPQWTSKRMNAAAEPGLAYNHSEEKKVAGISDSDLASDDWHRDQGVGAMARDEGAWVSSEATGQAGLDLESQRMLYDELPILEKQEERRRIVAKNLEIEEWRSQTRDEPDRDWEELLTRNPFQSSLNSSIEFDDDSNLLRPLDDDNLEIRENRLLQGQAYYSNAFQMDATSADFELVSRPRHWNDAPSIPDVTRTTHQPLTANEACLKWAHLSDAISVASRAATCGSRRRTLSDSHIDELDAYYLERNDFVYEVPIDQDAEKRKQSIFDQGLERLDQLFGKRGDSTPKRYPSSKFSTNTLEGPRNKLQSRHNDPGSLSVPSLNHRYSAPSMNTAFTAMTDEDEETEDFIMPDLTKEHLVPSFEGFQDHIRYLNPGMDSQHGWLIKRIADHQEVRFKHLLDLRIKHSQAILSGSCPSGHLCLASVVENTSKGKVEQTLSEALKVEADLSDNNSNSGDVTEDTFPAGVPMPPVRNFPVEFECNTCFKAQKFQIPAVSISSPQGSFGFFNVFNYMDPSLKSAGFGSRGSPCLLNPIRRDGSKGIRHVLHLASTVFSG
jgi:hypothetical protein